MPLDLSSLEKAVFSLKDALNSYIQTAFPGGSKEKEIMRDGVIQRFEYTIELSWKMMKRYLEMYGLEKADEFSRKDLIRTSVEQGLIQNAEGWLEYLRNRNLTSHTYDKATAEQVYGSAVRFLTDAQYLLERLKEKNK